MDRRDFMKSAAMTGGLEALLRASIARCSRAGNAKCLHLRRCPLCKAALPFCDPTKFCRLGQQIEVEYVTAHAEHQELSTQFNAEPDSLR